MTHLYRCTRFQGKEQGDIIEKGKYLGREADVMPLLSISSFDREQPKRLNDYHGEIYKRHFFSSPPAPSSPSRARNRAIGGEKTGVKRLYGRDKKASSVGVSLPSHFIS